MERPAAAIALQSQNRWSLMETGIVFNNLSIGDACDHFVKKNIIGC
jgi:hypothetical protein